MSARKVRKGRPPLPKGVVKAAIFPIRLSTDERESIERAAKKTGERASEWARRVLLNAAK